jgi:peptide chain release factor 2
MSDRLKTIEELTAKLAELAKVLGLETKRRQLAADQELQTASDFWSDQERAVAIGQEIERLTAQLEPFSRLAQELTEISALAALAEEEGEEAMLTEVDEKLAALLADFKQLEFYSLLSGPYDDAPAILSIHAGTGGVDAQDFALMLKH